MSLEGVGGKQAIFKYKCEERAVLSLKKFKERSKRNRVHASIYVQSVSAVLRRAYLIFIVRKVWQKLHSKNFFFKFYVKFINKLFREMAAQYIINSAKRKTLRKADTPQIRPIENFWGRRHWHGTKIVLLLKVAFISKSPLNWTFFYVIT